MKFLEFFETVKSRAKDINFSCDRLDLLRNGGDPSWYGVHYKRPFMIDYENGIFFQSQTEMIVINHDLTDNYALHVLFHEIAHASGMPTRLNRYMMSDGAYQKSVPIRAIEECIADTTAIKIMRHFNLSSKKIETIHTDYLRYWHRYLPQDPAVFKFIESKSKQAFEYVLTQWCPDLERLEIEQKEKMQDFCKYF